MTTSTRLHRVTARRTQFPRGARRLVLVTAIAMSAVVLSGCGGSDNGSRASSTTASTAAAPTTAGRARTSTTAPGPNPNAPEIVAPGDIPDNQAFVPYQSAGGFTVKVPEGWSRTDIAADHVSFSDKYNTIDLRWQPRPAPPTEASLQSELEAQAPPGYTLTKVATVQRPAGPVVVATYGRTSDPNAVTGKRIVLDVEQYEFWHNGTSATVTLSGAKGSDNVDPWKTVTDSLTWTR